MRLVLRALGGFCLLAVCLALAGPAGATSIVIDGVNDFAPADTYPTSSLGFTGYATHDGSSLYLGFDGPAMFAAPTTTWLVAYIGTGAPGATAGITIGSQQPSLSFSATHVLRWRLDGFVQDVQAYNGSTWVTAAIGSSIAMSGNYFEVGILLSALGSPAASISPRIC